MVSVRALPAAIVLICLTALQTDAQTPPAKPAQPPPPVSSEPQSTTASYGAWILRCTHHKNGNIDLQICEIDQAMVPQGRQNPIAQIAIAELTPKAEWHITAVVPTNITFDNAPKIAAQDKDPATELVWKRCLPGGCFAEGTLKEETLHRWRGVTGDTGRLYFTDAFGHHYAIQFSYRGFSQALDALAKEHS